MQEDTTTLRISKKLKDVLKGMKVHPRETYEQLIVRAVGSLKTKGELHTSKKVDASYSQEREIKEQ